MCGVGALFIYIVPTLQQLLRLNIHNCYENLPTPTPILCLMRSTSHRSFIRCALENNSCYDASNLSELYDCLNMFTLKMRSTNCYDKLTVEMLPAKDEKGKPVPGGVNVKIVAKER